MFSSTCCIPIPRFYSEGPILLDSASIIDFLNLHPKTLILTLDYYLSVKVSHTTIINPFVPNAPFLYPLKMFSRGREKVHWEQMG